MLNMYWSWIFLTVISLLVQPSQALHIHQDVARNQETTLSGLWFRALIEPTKPAPNTALIVLILLALLLLILGAIGAFLWYRRKTSQRTNNSEKGVLYDSQPRGDIEKGSNRFSSRFSEKRGYGFAEEHLTSAAIKKPAPPMLPLLPKQPTILERISDARTSLFFPNPRASAQFSEGYRVLVPPPPAVHRPAADRQQSARLRKPSTASQAEFPSPRNPFVPSPSRLSANLQIMTPPEFSAPANVPSGLLEKTTRQDPARAERVRMLRMDLTEDFMEIENLSAPSQVMHLSEASLARLKGTKTAKTGKSVRYMLPSSPRNLLVAARSAATVNKTPSVSSFRPLFLSPKTAKT